MAKAKAKGTGKGIELLSAARNVGTPTTIDVSGDSEGDVATVELYMVGNPSPVQTKTSPAGEWTVSFHGTDTGENYYAKATVGTEVDFEDVTPPATPGAEIGTRRRTGRTVTVTGTKWPVGETVVIRILGTKQGNPGRFDPVSEQVDSVRILDAAGSFSSEFTFHASYRRFCAIVAGGGFCVVTKR